MTAAKTKAKTAEPEVEEAPAPVVETRVSFDGLRAVDTIDGIQQESRDATFAEQVAELAPQVLEQAVGIVHGADGGTVSTDGAVITITLNPR